ncbi:MAG TPA: hypothetical protein VF911_13695, partial [Thermoanaerobaculia bacterium]
TSGTVGNSPGSISYPELRDYERRLPVGYLTSDQRHRARAWAGYDVPMPSVLGGLNISVLHSFESGTPYSAVQNINLTNFLPTLLNGAPYKTYSSGQQYYFSERGEYRLDDVNSTDVGLNYRLPISRFELFAQAEVLNVFNRQTVRVVNTTVATANTSTNFTPFNPFTTTQLIECPQGASGATCKAMGAHWQKGASFGQPTSATASTPGNAFTSNYQTARTYRFSAGFRF